MNKSELDPDPDFSSFVNAGHTGTYGIRLTQTEDKTNPG